MKRAKIFSAILAAALLLTACGKSPGTDKLDSMNDSEYTDASDSSSGQSAAPVAVGFTEEDRELQKILSDLQPLANEIYRWLGDGGPWLGEIQVRFSDRDEVYTYCRFGGIAEGDLLEKPKTCAEMKALMLDYFSEDRTEKFLNEYFSVCGLVEDKDGTYTLKNETGKGHTLFIEVEGELYHLGTDSHSGIFIFPDSEKVVSKTDDTIEFTYLPDYWHESFLEERLECLNDAVLYSEQANRGTLKYERGGWKIDYLQDQTDEGSDQSSDETPPVPVGFTDEDRELQKILSDLQPPANEIYRWLNNGSYPSDEIQVRFAHDRSLVHRYHRFGGRRGDDLLEKPTSCEEMKTLMLEYFSAERTEKFFSKYFSVCSIVDNADGIYTLKNDVGKYTLFIELDGELYHLGTDSVSGIWIVDGSAKVISKTDNTIEFTYLDENWVRSVYEANDTTILNDTELYSKYAINGTLKYERGGWKIEYLEYPFRE